MSLRDHLSEIHTANGRLTPALVVHTARAKDHPLHNRFEWNDKVAGEKYRLVQAAELIRSVKIVHAPEDDTPPDERVRQYHPITRAGETSYEPIEDIMRDDVSTQMLLRQAEREWRQMHRRYKHLKQFLEIVREDVA